MAISDTVFRLDFPSDFLDTNGANKNLPRDANGTYRPRLMPLHLTRWTGREKILAIAPVKPYPELALIWMK